MLKNKIIISLDAVLEKTTVILFSLYTCRSVLLAFDKTTYLSWFAFLSTWTARLCLPIGFLFLLRHRIVDSSRLALLLLPILHWFMQVTHTYGGYGGGAELGVLTFILFILFSNKIKIKIFEEFYRIVQVQNIISVFLWICFFLNINIGFHQVLFYSENSQEQMWYYYRWGIFAIYNAGVDYRLCGIFNEPGGLGTLCALLYICTAHKTKAWEKILLLVTGTLTFSLAFFLLIFVYLAVYLWQKRPSNILIIALAVGLFLMIPQIDFHNDALNRSAARMAIVDGRLAGDNRISSIFDYYYKDFLKTNDVYLGKGAGFSFGGANSSYKSHYIVPYGIVGTALLLGSWLAATWHYTAKDKNALLYAAFFFLSLYQRPAAIFAIWGYVMLMGGISYQKVDSQLKEEASKQ